MDLKEFLSRSTDTRHPWEISRLHFFTHLLKPLLKKPLQVLDVGSGDTWLARRLYKILPNGSWMTCVDENYTAAMISRMSQKVPVELTSTLPADRVFDMILMLDVLEHVQDDGSFLDQILKHAGPSTAIIVSVPAYGALFGSHDRWLAHVRRYSRRGLRRLLEEHGLEIKTSGGLFHSLLYIRAIQVVLEKALGARQEPKGVKDWQAGPIVTRLVWTALDFDWKLSAVLRTVGLSLPGLSWWCVCQKRS